VLQEEADRRRGLEGGVDVLLAVVDALAVVVVVVI